MIYDISRFKERIANAVLSERSFGRNEHAQGVLLKRDGTCYMWKVSYGHERDDIFLFVEDILHSSAPRHGVRDISEWNSLFSVLVDKVPSTIEIVQEGMDFY